MATKSTPSEKAQVAAEKEAAKEDDSKARDTTAPDPALRTHSDEARAADAQREADAVAAKGEAGKSADDKELETKSITAETTTIAPGDPVPLGTLVTTLPPEPKREYPTPQAEQEPSLADLRDQENNPKGPATVEGQLASDLSPDAKAEADKE